jgi:hypothetical protein
VVLVTRKKSGSPKNKRDEKIDMEQFLDERWEVTEDGKIRA